MTYATVIDLIDKAKVAGLETTGVVNELLGDTFEAWLDSQHLGEITEEEEDALRRAFDEGFGICMHPKA